QKPRRWAKCRSLAALGMTGPLGMTGAMSVTDAVPGELEEDVLERGDLGAEAAHLDVLADDAVNLLGDEVVALTLERLHRSVCGGERDRAFGAVLPNEVGRLPHLDQLPVLDDRDAVTQALGFLHEVRREEDGGA